MKVPGNRAYLCRIRIGEGFCFVLLVCVCERDFCLSIYGNLLQLNISVIKDVMMHLQLLYKYSKKYLRQEGS